MPLDVVVYGDLLFVINFSMDYLTLTLVSLILHRKVRLPGLILAAAIGGVYGVAAVVCEGNPVLGLLIHLAVSLVMCYCTFDRPFLGCTALLYGVGLLLGGTVSALFSMLHRRGFGETGWESGGMEVLSEPIPLGWMAVLTLLTGAAALVCGRWTRRKRKSPDASVTAEDEGRTLSFRGLCDSGNLLCDPITGAPVILLSPTRLSPLLPEAIRPLLAENGLETMTTLEPTKLRKVRLIPMTSAGGDGMLIGYYPQTVKVDGITRRACLACDPKHPDEKRFGGAEGLVPSVLTEGHL